MHRPNSNQQKRKKLVKDKIKEIYDKSHQNYNTLEITNKIHNLVKSYQNVPLENI